MTKKFLTVALLVIALTAGIFGAAAYQLNSTPISSEKQPPTDTSSPDLPTPIQTPVTTPTYNQTPASELSVITTSPIPTPAPTLTPFETLISPSVTVRLVAGQWDYTGLPFIIRTPVTFNVSINDPTYNSLMSQLAVQNMSVVFLALYNGTTTVWSPDGTDSISQYGVKANNYTITNVGTGQFAITLYPSGNATASQGSGGLPHQLADCFDRWLIANVQ